MLLFLASRHVPKSILDGQIIAIKDNIWTTRFPTTCASAILQAFQTPIDANVVNALEQAGALVIGKTNMDEFGMGSHSTNSHQGPVRNNIVAGLHRSTGGSSGGSAMAVLNEQCRIALGTDTGGSVRLPAAYTGLIGFKPSYGRLSRYGVVPYANSLDTVGIVGSHCEDILRTFGVHTENLQTSKSSNPTNPQPEKLDRPDSNDPTCLNQKTRRRIASLKSARFHQRAGSPIRVIRTPSTARMDASSFPTQRRRQYPSLVSGTDWSRTIGVPSEYNIEEMSDSVREAWNRTLSQLDARGHTIVPISLPTTKAALSAYYVLAPAEASSNLAKYDGIRYGVRCQSHPDQTPTSVLYSSTRGAGFGPEVQRRILLGTYTLSSAALSNHFIQAQKIRRLVQRDFDAVFKLPNPLHTHTPAPPIGVDYIVCPTAPTPPPRLLDLTSLSTASSPLDAYTTDIFTVPASLAGLPAISVPAPQSPQSRFVDHANVGMQVIGQFGDDEAVIKFVLAELQPTKKEVAHYSRRGKKKYL